MLQRSSCAPKCARLDTVNDARRPGRAWPHWEDVSAVEDGSSSQPLNRRAVYAAGITDAAARGNEAAALPLRPIAGAIFLLPASAADVPIVHRQCAAKAVCGFSSSL
ncbi:hypothetical protein MTO96_049644 [Rhipicephalus appendiculatus]